MLAIAAALASVNIWTGGPVFALWVGSQFQGWIESRATGTGVSMEGVLAVVVVLAAVETALVRLVTKVGDAYDKLIGRPHKGRRPPPRGYEAWAVKARNRSKTNTGSVQSSGSPSSASSPACWRLRLGFSSPLARHCRTEFPKPSGCRRAMSRENADRDQGVRDLVLLPVRLTDRPALGERLGAPEQHALERKRERSPIRELGAEQLRDSARRRPRMPLPSAAAAGSP